MRLIILYLALFGKKEISLLWSLSNKTVMFGRLFYYFVVQEEGENEWLNYIIVTAYPWVYGS